MGFLAVAPRGPKLLAAGLAPAGPLPRRAAKDSVAGFVAMHN
jgi:hypothetical protein